MRQWWWQLLAVVLALGPGAGPAPALEELRPALKELSQKLAGVAREQRKAALAVGPFTGPAKYQASTGPGIQKVLMEELQQRGLRIDRQADLEVKGEYRPVPNPRQQTLELVLSATVVDNTTGAKVAELRGTVHDPGVLPQVLGASCVDPRAELIRLGQEAGKSSQAIREEVRQLDDPRVKSRLVAVALGMETPAKVPPPEPGPQVDGTTVRAAAGRPYAVEVLVRKAGGYQPLKPALTGGQAFAPLEKDDVFAVRLVNDADHDVAVELTLDGLNLFAFSEAAGVRFVVVPRKQATVIPGWHRTAEKVEAFVLTDYGKSAAAEKLIAADQVGTITAAFRAAWTEKEGPPGDEGGGRSLGVGRGEEIRVRSETVERQVGRLRDVVSVRYQKPGR